MEKKPQVAECYNMLYEESDSYIILIVKQMWLKKDKIKELHLAWIASVVDPMEPILKKNMVSINNSRI